jgi:serine/threonine protein kinase
LLGHAKASEDTLQHPHTGLLEAFLACSDILPLEGDNDIGFDTFEQFAQKQNIVKADLFSGPLAKTFRALDEELSEQTLSFVVDNHSIIYHFKDKRCTDIYNIEINLDSYTYVSTLGAGSNGTARLYKNKDGREIVLKTPNPAIPHSGYYRDRKRDIEIAKLLYPNDGFYCINEHTRCVDDGKGKIVPAYGFYAIAPYIQSENLTEFCQKIKTTSELVETLLALTQEMQRIHTANVIHGDIHPANIRIWRDPATNKVGVRFIDFETSYYRYSEHARKTLHRPPHWAPERFDSHTEESAMCAGESFEFPNLESHPAQDMFSFGYTLWSALYHHPLLKQLNFIAKFYHDCGKPQSDRPLAERLIYELMRHAKHENAVASPSSTALFFKQGIAGKERIIFENFFTPREEERKSQNEPMVKLPNQHSILDRKKPAPAYVPPKPDQSYTIPTLIDFGITATAILKRFSGFSRS